MRRCEESTFPAFDREPLFYRYWLPLDREVHGAIVLLHRGHEHSGRVEHLVDELYVPLARPALKLGLALRGNFFVKSYVKARYLTHDPERIASFEADPLIAREVSLVAAAGFEKITERIDPWGIFTVSLARRIDREAEAARSRTAEARLPTDEARSPLAEARSVKAPAAHG